ncbi:MAG: hypothetical protein JST54_32750 [Deltaproteobacteria bacterium]|nr:hypothetical protein [Deltaproteobacteria bacterium]
MGAVALLALVGCRTPTAVLGDVDHHYLEQEPSVSDPKIGKSHAFPAALRIVVSGDALGPMHYIGRTAHNALFAQPAYPEFAFKVVFASADTSFFGNSDYANPASIWCNVFFGYYEIDAPTRLWTRPFGYQSASPDSPVALEDIVRIGKADWNYFSNHMYGVPRDAIVPYDVVDMAAVKTRDLGREKIGRDYWDHITLADVTVVTAVRSTKDTRDLENTDTVYSDAWRYAFGTAPRSDAVNQSFAPTKMSGEFFMSFRKQRDEEYGEEVYKTFIFGGTFGQGYPDAAENARFLALQLASLKKIIPSEKRTGFKQDRAAPASPDAQATHSTSMSYSHNP